MPCVLPAARTRVVANALLGLQKLDREMARLTQKGQNYEDRRRALQLVIQELRKIVVPKIEP